MVEVVEVATEVAVKVTDGGRGGGGAAGGAGVLRLCG